MNNVIKERVGRVEISKDYNDEGVIVSEAYSVVGEIMLVRDMVGDGICRETYFVNKKVVNAKKYEQARKEYDEMPVANSDFDHVGKVLQQVSDGSVLSGSGVDFDANENDRFCISLIGERSARYLRHWLEQNDDMVRTLGIMSEEETKLLLVSLEEAGAEEIWVIEVESGGELDKWENSGGICILLPEDESQRKEVINIGNKIAEEKGFDGVPDVGQKYLFILLD